jgi:signal peptidase I
MSDTASDTKVKARGKKRSVPHRSTWRVVLEYTRAIGLAVLLALVIRQLVIQAFRIPTGSMERTLLVGDFLFVNKFLYGAKTPERIRLFGHTLVRDLPVLKLPALRQPRQGDIIVFEYPQDRDLDYIKRCVAVAGDTVQVRDGLLYVNGERYESNFGDRDGDHSCVQDWRSPEACFGPYVVPEGDIFMMGDNRYNSADSRYWGALPVDLIKGKAMFIYWSWDKTKMRPRFSRIGDIIR